MKKKLLFYQPPPLKWWHHLWTALIKHNMYPCSTIAGNACHAWIKLIEADSYVNVWFFVCCNSLPILLYEVGLVMDLPKLMQGKWGRGATKVIYRQPPYCWSWSLWAEGSWTVALPAALLPASYRPLQTVPVRAPLGVEWYILGGGDTPYIASPLLLLEPSKISQPLLPFLPPW